MRVADLAADDQGKWEEMRRNGHISGTSTLTCKDGSRIEFTYVAGATVVAGMPVYVSVGTA